MVSNITKERREYLLNNLLLFMKNEIEDDGATINTYWFEVKYPEKVYIMGVKEPKLEPASKDIIKFQAKCPFEKEELDTVVKYGIAHELLERYTYDSFQITYQGMNQAEEYEEYLEECVSDNQIIINDFVESEDSLVNEKVIKSRNLYLTKDLDGALENIWGAFERIKTIYTELDKKDSAKKVCNICATSLDFDCINNEFVALTNIGNNYQIRHFETNKKPLNDNNTKIYLYFRMLSLINFAIKQLKEAENDL